MIPADDNPPFTMEVVTDPAEIARMNEQHARFERNLRWHQAHVLEFAEAHRGKYVCIAGQELFVAETAEEAIAKARVAHPDDNGYFFHYIFPRKAYRLHGSTIRFRKRR